MNITEDLKRTARPKGKFWDSISVLKEKDNKGCEFFLTCMFEKMGDSYTYTNTELQSLLTKHTGVRMHRDRVSEIRTMYSSREELPI